MTIASPEHWHAQMTLDALDAGKAVYCEKPLTHTIPEALAVMKKQQTTKLPLQVGVQGMSDDSYISAQKAIKDGVLGRVVQAQIEYVRRYGEQGPFCVPDLKDDMPKPADLDWDAWLGSAPQSNGTHTTISNGETIPCIREALLPIYSCTASLES